jgi:pilus assembly protein FimV
LRAEIDIPEINAEEAGSLRAAVAQPDAFRAAGLDYNAVLAGAQVSLQRRPDGRAYIRITSDRIVTEPFIDLILEVEDEGCIGEPGRQPAPSKLGDLSRR